MSVKYMCEAGELKRVRLKEDIANQLLKETEKLK